MEYSAVCFLFFYWVVSVKSDVWLLFLQPLLDGKDLDIEVDSTADSDSEEYFDEDDEDDDPFANIPIKVFPVPLFFFPSYFRKFPSNWFFFCETTILIFLKDENNQHSDPNSYAWCLMRYASIHLAQGILERFLSLAGVEPSGN